MAACKRILLICHRYAPYPGGTENYMRDIAEELLSRGHEVAVLAQMHQGNLNGVNVTSDLGALYYDWDLIVIHLCYLQLQEYVVSILHTVPSPVLFLPIEPEISPKYIKAATDAKFLGCSTIEDWDWAKQLRVANKAVPVRHGIDAKRSKAKHFNFKKKYGINTDLMILSSGGFVVHKRHLELIELFKKTNRKDITLVITGGDPRGITMPPPTENIKSFLLEDKEEMLDAMACADLYIMHSSREGFGLVILEAMLNRTPWAGTNLAGMRLLSDYGFAYDNDEQLIEYINNFTPVSAEELERRRDFVIQNHLIRNTVDDILKLA